jgi:hypothetical protein
MGSNSNRNSMGVYSKYNILGGEKWKKIKSLMDFNGLH